MPDMFTETPTMTPETSTAPVATAPATPSTTPRARTPGRPLADEIAAAAAVVARGGAETVVLPVAGFAVEVRSMTAGDRQRLLNLVVGRTEASVDHAEYFPRVIASTAHDPETGARVWPGTDAATLEQIRALPADDSDVLFATGMKVSGLLKAVTRELGNGSGETGSADSSSSSPSDSGAPSSGSSAT